MENGQLLYEGKAKRVYETMDPDTVRIEYKDSATAFNGEKKAEITGKGRLNNEITARLFTELEKKGINTHFIRKLSHTEQLVKKVKMIPLEVIVRNLAAGSFSKRYGIEEGTPLNRPLVEFCLKNDELGDPTIAEEVIDVLGIATLDEVHRLKSLALSVNEVLTSLFQRIGVILVDFKLEFGTDGKGNLLLADEVSPDTCRLWDGQTKEKFDKDVFRRDLGNLTEAYRKILERLGGKGNV